MVSAVQRLSIDGGGPGALQKDNRSPTSKLRDCEPANEGEIAFRILTTMTEFGIPNNSRGVKTPSR